MNLHDSNYYRLMMEHLLWCTADDSSLDYFSNLGDNDTSSTNKRHLQIFVEFIYRCLKCNLIKLNIGYQGTSLDANNAIDSLEELARVMAKRPLNLGIGQFNQLNLYIWVAEQVCATELLDNIAKECDLVAYEDDVDFSTEKGRKFKDEIEKVWADHGLPWDLTQPLFPVP